MRRDYIKSDYVLWLILCLSIMAGYLSGANVKNFFYATMFVLFALPSVGMFMLVRGLRLPTEYLVSVSIAVILIFLATVANSYFSLNYVVLLFIITIVCYVVSARPKINGLLIATNMIYLIYFILSLLLYVGVIPPYKDATMFEYDQFTLLGSPFRAFAGFYGSSATIDSYSVFVGLINLFFNKSIVSRWFFVVLCMCVTVATLRYTPLIALISAVVGAICWGCIGNRRIRTGYVFALTVVIFSTPLIAMLMVDRFGYELLLFLDLGTSGRASIWLDMLPRFFSHTNSLDIVLFGSRDTVQFAADLGFSDNHLVENPHNNYLSFLIKYGVIGWLFLLVVSGYILVSLRKSFYFLVALFVMLTAITNNETFGVYYPVYLIWIGVFYNYSKGFNN